MPRYEFSSFAFFAITLFNCFVTLCERGIDAHSLEQRKEKAHAEAQANATDPSPSMLGKTRSRNEPLKYFTRPALSAVPELPAGIRNAQKQPSAVDGRFLLGALSADEREASCVVVPFAEFARRYFAKHKIK